MTKEQWNKAAAEMVPHLEAIRQIVRDNKMKQLCMSAFGDGYVDACYINPEDGKHYRVDGKDGCYGSDCDFEPIGKYDIKKALTPES